VAFGSGAVLLVGDSTLSANGNLASASAGAQAFSFGDNYLFDTNPLLRRGFLTALLKE